MGLPLVPFPLASPEELLVLLEGGSLLGWHEPDESRDSRPDL
jgi:hypothetical protein